MIHADYDTVGACLSCVGMKREEYLCQETIAVEEMNKRESRILHGIEEKQKNSG